MSCVFAHCVFIHRNLGFKSLRAAEDKKMAMILFRDHWIPKSEQKQYWDPGNTCRCLKVFLIMGDNGGGTVNTGYLVGWDQRGCQTSHDVLDNPQPQRMICSKILIGLRLRNSTTEIFKTCKTYYIDPSFYVVCLTSSSFTQLVHLRAYWLKGMISETQQSEKISKSISGLKVQNTKNNFMS
jgi:hypothetical protein